MSEKQEEPQIITSSEMISAQRLDEFVELVREGGAVDPRSVEQKLPRTQKVAFIERQGKMVAVAAMKKPVPTYAEHFSGLSGFDLDGDLRELGYVVVSKPCQGQHLSSRVVDKILAEFGNESVFATTSESKMKCLLANRGFRWVGNEWDSKRPGERLSLWIKGPGMSVPEQGVL